MSSIHDVARSLPLPGADDPGQVRVMKFGGTSLGSPDRLAQVARVIRQARAEGPVAVVVSAMGHTTDRLIDAASAAAGGDLAAAEAIVDAIADLAATNAIVALRDLDAAAHTRPAEVTTVVRAQLAELRRVLHGVSLLRERSPQTLDLVMSFGERISAQLLAELLSACGLPARYVDARTFVVTDARFGDAVVDPHASRARLADARCAWDEHLPIVTGFIGSTADGRTTTLGRNGSDYTASLLATWLGARDVTVWTDVAGVMTADPGIVTDAYPLAHLAYMEALELVDFGATMFHPRTMIPLIESGIAMRIRSTMNPQDPGTLVDAQGAGDSAAATSVTSREHLALVGVQVRRMAHQAQVASRVLRALDEAGVTVWMATQAAHGQAAAVAVPLAQVPRATEVVQSELAVELDRGEVELPTINAPVTLLTLVAEAMSQTPDVAGRFFHALGSLGIRVRAIAQGASARSISCVIDAADTTNAVRTVHAAFNFAHQEVSLLVLGKGTVGAQLIQEVRGGRVRLERDHDLRIRVVGVADRQRSEFDEQGIRLEGWKERLAAGPPDDDPRRLLALLDRLRRLPVPVLVDCTAADGMEDLYREAFQRGIHVVTANKKPLTIPMAERDRILSSARRHHREYRYETTVGASLPVINTLKDLVRTGDDVRLIEGAFSGTLGFITNELMAGVTISEATRRARDGGYTEPRPQEDLSGTDVARKALILARELGLRIELEDIEIEPLIPRGLIDEPTAEAFMAELQAIDGGMADRIDAYRRDGRALRYLARIDPRSRDGGPPRVRGGPVGVALDHPASRLRGTEAFVAFSTRRYSDYPLIVQGAGAGGAVTAAGVLADVLALSQGLRGR